MKIFPPAKFPRTSAGRQHPFLPISRSAFYTVAGAAIFVAAASFLCFDIRIAIISCALGWTMLAIAASDAERYLIPDILSLPAIPAGILLTRFLANAEEADQLTLEHIGAALFGAALLYGVRVLYFAFRQREGLGLGDVKLGAAAGAWTGMQGSTHVLLLACVMAISYVGLLKLQRKEVSATTAVPLGVFLAPAIWLIWFFEASDIASEILNPVASWFAFPIT